MNLKHMKSAILTLDNGESISVELIGKGRFSEAWKNSHYVYVITRERSWGTDYSKRLIEGLETDNPHIPKIELIGELDSDRSDVFRMPYYRPLTAKDKNAWAQYKELKRIKMRCWDEGFNKYHLWNGRKKVSAHAYLIVEDIRQAVKESDIIQPSVKDAVDLLVDMLSDAGLPSWMLEFERKCNLAVDEEGRLILLDCLFDLEVIERYRNRNRNKQTY